VHFSSISPFSKALAWTGLFVKYMSVALSMSFIVSFKLLYLACFDISSMPKIVVPSMDTSNTITINSSVSVKPFYVYLLCQKC